MKNRIVWAGLLSLVIVGWVRSEDPPKAAIVLSPAQSAAKGRELAEAVESVERLSGEGNYSEALAKAERALSLAREVYGNLHAKTANYVDKVGDLRALTGNYAGALGLRKESVAIRREIHGNNDWRTSDAERKLASTEKIIALDEGARTAIARYMRKDEEAGRLFRQRRFADAEREYLAVVKGYTNLLGGETYEVAQAWWSIGSARMQTANFEGARQAITETLAIYDKVLVKEHPSIPAALTTLGGIQSLQGDNAAAKKSTREAIDLFRKVPEPDKIQIALALQSLGLVQRALGEYKDARKSIQDALTIMRKELPPDNLSLGTSLDALGLVQVALKEHAEAKKSFEEALRIKRQKLPPDDLRIATSFSGLAAAQKGLGEYEKAEATQRDVIAIERRYPRTLEFADSLASLADLQQMLSKDQDAKKNLQEAVGIYRRGLPQSVKQTSATLNALGILHKSFGEYVEARNCYKEALQICNATLPDDDLTIANVRANIATLHLALREYPEAEQSLRAALGVFRKKLPEDDLTLGDALNNLGLVQQQLGQFKDAKISLHAALEIKRKKLPPDDLKISDTLTNLGHIESDLEEHAEAKKSLQEALKIRLNKLPANHRQIAESWLNLGSEQVILREYADASRSFHTALDIRRKTHAPDHPDVAVALYNVGRLALERGDLKGAARALTEGIPILRRQIHSWALAQAEREQLAVAVEARGFLDTLLSAADNQSAVYSEVIQWKAATTARQRLARLIRDDADPLVRKKIAELGQLNEMLLRLAYSDSATKKENVNFQDLDSRRAELERELTNTSEAFHRFVTESKAGAKEIQTALASQSTPIVLIDFLEYCHVEPLASGQVAKTIESRMLAFVLRSDQPGVEVVPLGKSSDLKGVIDRWRKRYANRERPKDGESDPGAELRQQVWLKLEPHLGKPKLVLVSPDGPLNYLPLAALPGNQPSTFLVHEYAFVTLPAPLLLPEMIAKKPIRPETPSLLLVGGVDFGKAAEVPIPPGKLPSVPTNWKELPGTGQELTELHAQFKAAFPTAVAPTILDKDRATKAAFVSAAPLHTYIHLATHGFFADEDESSAFDPDQRSGPIRLHRALSGRHPGLLSGVVFSGVNRPRLGAVEHCLLVALEAGELDLRRAELVTLSACDTGSGPTGGGEGVLGLQRAFHVGGAKAVIASHWKVPDAATCALMREFYREAWSESPASKAEALRRAQVRMIEGWDGAQGELRGPTEPKGDNGLPPYFWAAFTLAGDWR